MKSLRRKGIWLLYVLLVALITYAAALHYVPTLVMQRVAERIGPPNQIRHARQADASARAVVRPSPNLLYSICAYDLSSGPLRITAPVPAGTYWSVSVFDARSNNIFVENDLQAGQSVDFLLADTRTLSQTNGLPVVFSTTTRGVVLFRTVIDSKTDLDRLDKVRRQARCSPVSSQP